MRLFQRNNAARLANGPERKKSRMHVANGMQPALCDRFESSGLRFSLAPMRQRLHPFKFEVADGSIPAGVGRARPCSKRSANREPCSR